jgi:hypothetical protein
VSESVPSTSTLLCDDKTNVTIKHLCSDETVPSDEMMNLILGDL